MMNEEWMRQWKRGAELECMRSVELAEKLRGMGWVIRGRRNKLAYKNAILHLEEFDVPEQIVKDLRLERIEPELELEAAAIGKDGDGCQLVSLDVSRGSGIAGGGEAGQKPMGRDEALAVVKRVAAGSPVRNYEG